MVPGLLEAEPAPTALYLSINELPWPSRSTRRTTIIKTALVSHETVR
jgi:hypothetical protein